MSDEKTPEEIVAEAKAEAEVDPVAPPTSGEESQVIITDEEKEAVGKLARELLDGNEDFRKVLGTMVASRQLYAMAVREMEFLVADLPEDKQHELLEECLIQAAAHQASQEFDENDLYMGFQETVYPWMVKTVEKHNKIEKQQREKDATEWEAARRERPLPVGVKFDSSLENLLPRDKALVLVGWGPAVTHVIDKMMTSVLAAQHPEQLFYVVRLLRHAPKKLEPHPQLLRMAGKDWEGCTAANTTWPKLFQAKLLPAMSEPLDLFIVDDLRHAYAGLVGHRATPSRAGSHANKKFRDWARKMGSGMIFGIQLEDKEPPNLGGPEWEQLRTWSVLRPVWLKDEEGAMDLSLMIGRDTLIEKLPRNYLSEGQGGGNIIVTGK